MNLLEIAIQEIVSKAKAVEWKLYRDKDCTGEVINHPFLAILNELDKQQSAWGKVMSDVAIQELTKEEDNGTEAQTR